MSFNALECGRRIKQLRNKRGWTQEQLAERLNVSWSHIAKMETGKKAPSLDLVIEIAEEFGVSLDYMVLGKE